MFYFKFLMLINFYPIHFIINFVHFCFLKFIIKLVLLKHFHFFVKFVHPLLFYLITIKASMSDFY